MTLKSPPAHRFRKTYSRSRRLATITTIGAVLSVGVSGIGIAASRDLAAPQSALAAEPAIPDTPADPDSSPTELGVNFTPTVDGWVTGIRFYKSPINVGPRSGRLWTADGKLKATVAFEDESPSGWQSAYFSTPIKVDDNEKYVASYTAPHGHYADDVGVFTAGRTLTATAAILNAGVFSYALGFPNQMWRDSDYYVQPIITSNSPSSSPAQTTAPQSTRSSTSVPVPPPTAPTAGSTPATSTAPAATTATSTAAEPSFPDASNTGVPSGISLSPYTGPCAITTPNTIIDSRLVNCSLSIRASGVKITRSKINGLVSTDEASIGYSFTISDSEVDAGNAAGTGIGGVDFTATRVHVHGGNRSIYCWHDCIIQDSYVHGQFTDRTGVSHESGIRMSSNTTLLHNTITCDAPDVPPDAGCSADLTGYGDFGPVQNNLIQGNLFLAGTGGYCVYGGSSPGKPFSADTNHVIFKDNVWEAGSDKSHPSCWYGPVTSFDVNAPGNVWENNTFDNGKNVAPAN